MSTKPDDWNLPGGADCVMCGQRVEVRAFAAIQSEGHGARPEVILGAGEAGCYYHPQNRAAVPCDSCGRFLCQLCDLPLDGRHLCPQCVDSGVKTNQLSAADTQRTYYDSVALAFATWPIFFFYFTIFTAPITLYYVIRYWKQPQGILPRSKARFVIAALLAVAQLAGWVILIIVGVVAFTRTGGGIRD